MANIDPHNMNYITTDRLWRIADDLRRYANGINAYHETYGMDNSHRTIRTGVVNSPTKYYTVYIPTIYSTVNTK